MERERGKRGERETNWKRGRDRSRRKGERGRSRKEGKWERGIGREVKREEKGKEAGGREKMREME